MNLGLGPLTIFAFFQWTQRCVSSATAFISAIAFIIAVGSLSFVSFFIYRLASRPGGLEQLFSTNSPYNRRWGALYNMFHKNKIQFIIPNILAPLIRNAIVGFGRSG